MPIMTETALSPEIIDDAHSVAVWHLTGELLRIDEGVAGTVSPALHEIAEYINHIEALGRLVGWLDVMRSLHPADHGRLDLQALRTAAADVRLCSLDMGEDEALVRQAESGDARAQAERQYYRNRWQAAERVLDYLGGMQ